MEWFACSWACSRVFARCDMNGFFLHAYGLYKNEMNVMVSTSDVRLFEVGFLPWVRCYFVVIAVANSKIVWTKLLFKRSGSQLVISANICRTHMHSKWAPLPPKYVELMLENVRNQKFSTFHLRPQKSKYITKGSHQADFLWSRAVFAVPLYRYAQQRPVLRVALAGR